MVDDLIWTQTYIDEISLSLHYVWETGTHRALSDVPCASIVVVRVSYHKTVLLSCNSLHRIYSSSNYYILFSMMVKFCMLVAILSLVSGEVTFC